MKIKYISDVHLEFSRFPLVSDEKELDASKDEILLVAGDTILSNYLKEKRTDKEAQNLQWRFEEFLKAVSKFKNVYMIPGNHEAYGHGDVTTNVSIINDFIKRKEIDNVIMLDRDRVSLTDKVDLLATTLWTNMNNEDYSTMVTVNGMMNDFRVCNYQGHVFTTRDALFEFKQSFAWLKEQLLDKSKSYVVMTHHLPSFLGIDPQFKGDPMNYGYASDLDDFIIQNPHISHWIHGHTHYNVDYKIGETRILGNMRGYPSEVWSRRPTNWNGFKANKWFSVE